MISTKSDLIDSLKNNKIPANAKEAACTLLTAISGRTVTDSHGAELATIQIIAKIKSDKNKTREEKAILQSALQEILKKLTQK